MVSATRRRLCPDRVACIFCHSNKLQSGSEPLRSATVYIMISSAAVSYAERRGGGTYAAARKSCAEDHYDLAPVTAILTQSNFVFVLGSGNVWPALRNTSQPGSLPSQISIESSPCLHHEALCAASRLRLARCLALHRRKICMSDVMDAAAAATAYTSRHPVHL